MPFNVTLPVCAWREWHARYKELVAGFWQWLDAFSHSQLLAGSAFSRNISLVLPDADKVLVTMRVLPDQVREYVQLNGSYESCAEVIEAIVK